MENKNTTRKRKSKNSRKAKTTKSKNEKKKTKIARKVKGQENRKADTKKKQTNSLFVRDPEIQKNKWKCRSRIMGKAKMSLLRQFSQNH